MMLRIGAWNAEWARTGTERGEAVRDALIGGAFDVICLTEAYEDLLPPDGHAVSSEADYGYPIKPGRRKVILWSRQPWTHVDPVGSRTLPGGRYVSGVTESPIGMVRVVGVCVPWREAHVRSGRRNRRPWEEHSLFLQGLSGVLSSLPDPASTVLAGDFNQRIPRTGAPRSVFETLMTALGRFHVATAGVVQPTKRQLIDHVAHGQNLVSEKVSAWPGIHPDGLRMSDHDGVSVELGLHYREDAGRTRPTSSQQGC